MFRHTTVTVRLTQTGEKLVALASSSRGDYARADGLVGEDVAGEALRAVLTGQGVLRATA